MFKKLLNVAVGSKNGLLRVLGNSSVEFSHQLDQSCAIRQIEFIDCREPTTPAASNKKQKQQQQQKQQQSQAPGATAKLVVLTDNGQLHLFELKTVKPLNFSDSTTQTEAANATKDCCQQKDGQVLSQQLPETPEYTKLEYVGLLDYFSFRLDNDDRSKRVTTLEISSNGQQVFVGTESGNLYQVPIAKFEPVDEVLKKISDDQSNNCLSVLRETGIRPILDDEKLDAINEETGQKNASEDETTAMNLSDEPQIGQADVDEPYEIIKFEDDVVAQLGDEIKQKKQGAIESIKKHPSSNDKLLISYHRGLSVIYDIKGKQVNKYFYHNQILESSCFASNQSGDLFFTSHNDGSYIKWDTKKGSQSKADDDFIGQLYGPYPCKPMPKIQACTGLINDQPEDLIVFSGGMPRATYDDKNPVTIVRSDSDGKDSIKVVLDLTSKVLDFVVITRPRGSLGTGAKITGGGAGGKKNKNKQQQQQQQLRNQHIAVALAILAEEEFVVVDLLNSESYLEFPLPYLNCVQPSAITCNQHYSDVSDELYEQLVTFNRQNVKDKLSQNDWPIQGGKVINAPDVKSRDILLTGHEDGSVNMWDVSDLSMRHLLHIPTGRFFKSDDDELVPIDGPTMDGEDSQTPDEKQDSSWPPLKRVGRFDPYSDDTRLAIRRISLCAQSGTLLIAGTGGQVLVFELNQEQNEIDTLIPDEVTIVSDHRFTWKGREKLNIRPGAHKFEPGYQLVSYVQLDPPAAATSTDLRSDWNLFAVGSSYGFLLYDYKIKHSVINRCTLNVQDFAIVSGDAGAMSRKKSFRKSLRESFRRLRRGRSQRNQPTTAVASPSSDSLANDNQSGPRKPISRMTHVGVRTLNTPAADTAQQAAVAHRNLFSGERQVEQKIELSSIVKCITLTSAVITNNLSVFKPSLWIGTTSGQVLVYTIDLATKQTNANSTSSTSDHAQESSTSSSDPPKTVARLTKEIQLKHKAPIVAIFTSPEAPTNAASLDVAVPADSSKSTPEKHASELFQSGSEQKSRTSESETTEQSSDAQQVPTPQVDKSPSKTSQKDQPQQQPRVLICSEEQFKVFNLPNLKPFCKFKLTAHEGLRAKKISITQFLKPTQTSNGAPLAGSKLQSVTTLNSSKSLQSFATQTSPPASPVPPSETAAKDAQECPSDDAQQQRQQLQNSANGASKSSGKQAESNNNSLLAPNNNSSTQKQQQDKELLNAKFGAKANPSSVATSSSAAEKSTPTVEEQTDSAIFEPYMICMSNQGDCAIYSVPDLKRQAQIQVCKREDVNGIMSAMLTNYGEGYYLKSSSNFLRFSISSQRVLRVLSVV